MKKENNNFDPLFLTRLFGEKGRNYDESRIKKSIAFLFNSSNGILICGSYGKSTTSEMLASILNKNGFSSSFIGLGYYKNAVIQDGGFCILNPGSDLELISMLKPSLTVLCGISKSENPIEEQIPVYEKAVKKASVGAIINVDCLESSVFKDLNSNTLVYSSKGKADILARNISFSSEGSRFSISRKDIVLSPVGTPYLYGAMASFCTGEMLGLSKEEILNGLHGFRGTKGSLTKIGTMANVSLFYDYASYPFTISSALKDIRKITEKRLLIIFSPDRNDLSEEDALAFSRNLSKDDCVAVCNVFEEEDSCVHLVSLLKDNNIDARYFGNRRDSIKEMVTGATFGDTILILGKEDEKFSEYCSRIWTTLENKVL